MSNLKNITRTQLLLILFAFWLIIQSLFLKSLGIVTTLEATKYTDECQHLLLYGNFSDKKYLFYSVYILTHIFFYKLGFEIIGVYIFQLLLNLLATYLFFELTFKTTRKKSISFLAVLLLLLTQTFEMWTVYLYTESVFSSLVVIFCYCLLSLNHQQKWNMIFTVFLFFLLIFARPTGVLFIPILLIYFLFILIRQKKYLKALFFTSLATIIFVALVNHVMQSSDTFNFIKPFVEEQVICDVPVQVLNPDTSQTASQSLSDILNYIIHHKQQFAHLSFQRFISFWGLQRPFNSRSHNLFFAFFFYPIYFLGLIGFTKLYKQQKRVFIFIISTFFFFTLSVMLSCDEWSNRFIVPIIPFVMMLGAIGIYYCYTTLRIFYRKPQ